MGEASGGEWGWLALGFGSGWDKGGDWAGRLDRLRPAGPFGPVEGGLFNYYYSIFYFAFSFYLIFFSTLLNFSFYKIEKLCLKEH